MWDSASPERERGAKTGMELEGRGPRLSPEVPPGRNTLNQELMPSRPSSSLCPQDHLARRDLPDTGSDPVTRAYKATVARGMNRGFEGNARCRIPALPPPPGAWWSLRAPWPVSGRGMKLMDSTENLAPHVQKEPEEEREWGMGHRGGCLECHSPEAPRCRRQNGVSSRRPGGLRRALGAAMAPSPWVAAPLRCLLDSQTPSPQSRAQPWKGGGLARVANLSPSNTSTPALL